MAATNATSFDQNAIGANLVLSVYNSILQVSGANAVDGHRCCRSQYGFASTTAAASVEFYIYSPNAASVSLAPSGGVPPVTVGLVNNLASLSKYVGEDANGYGLASDGTVRNNGAVVATFSAGFALNDYVTVAWDAVNRTITWSKNGTVLGSVSSVAAGAWYYAATVSGNPGDLAVWANGGQTQARFPTTAGGWFHIGTGITPVYIANEPYLAAPADSRPNQRYAGDLDRTGTPMTVARAVRMWFWGPSMPSQLGSSSQIQISILDPNHQYDQLLQTDIRDQIVVVRRVGTGNAMTTAESIFTAVIDHCEAPTDQTKTLYCTDKIAQLQAQLIRPLFPPNADAAVASKPRPMRLGICRNYTPSAYDTTNLYYAATDIPISGVGKIRDQGKEEGYGIDVSLLADAMNFSRVAVPPGKFTVETTTYGGAYASTLTDLLSGDGVFGSTVNDGGGVVSTSTSSITPGSGAKVFSTLLLGGFTTGAPVTVTSRGAPTATMTGTVTSYTGGNLTVNVTSFGGTGAHTDWNIIGGVNQPHDWTGGGGYGSSDAMMTIWQVKGSAPNKYVEMQQKAFANYWLAHQTLTVAPGAGVAYEVVVQQAPYYGPGVDVNGNPITILPAYVGFGGLASQNLQFFPWTKFPVDNYNSGTKTFRGSFVNNQSTTLPLVFALFCNAMIQGTGGITSVLQITSIKLVALPSITQNVSLLGPGLDWMLQQLIVSHGPLALSDYDSTGAAAIDTATGYLYGLGVSENETPTVQASAKQVLDSCGADIYESRAGRLTAFQLTAPESATAVGSLTVTNFNGYLQVWPDRAENLTSRMSGTRNINPYSDSDFANVTTTDVPLIVRNQLKAAYQTTCVAGVTLPALYQHANNALPLPSCLDRAVDIQAEITRVCALYQQPRNFYVGQVFSQLGTLFEIGQVLFVQYPIGNLTNGQNLVVVGIEEQPTEELTTLVLWGL